MMENEHIKVQVLTSSHADPKIDGIGYGDYNPAICIPRTFFISAHAPSLLKVQFKKSGKYYLNGNFNRTTGIRNDSLFYNIRKESLNLLNFKPSLEYHSFYATEGSEYFFEIECKNNYGAHTIWSFWKADEEILDFELDSFSSVANKNLDSSSDYSLFIQTCNPKKKMAFRCVVSFLNKIARLPRKIVICSLDQINDGGIKFPGCVEFWTGRQFLADKMNRVGISTKAIDHIFDGFKTAGNPNMWLKYAIPRLCMPKEKILIIDDDVAFLGPCQELIDSKTYLTFMEDSHPFYGENTIRWYNKFYKTDKYGRKPPYVCAGMCMVDCSKMEYDPIFIDGMIQTSESDPDEQCAVGMEIIKNPDFTSLKPPKYHHGGFENQNIDLNNLELMHMQGRAVGWRSRPEFIKLVMSKNNQ